MLALSSMHICDLDTTEGDETKTANVKSLKGTT